MSLTKFPLLTCICSTELFSGFAFLLDLFWFISTHEDCASTATRSPPLMSQMRSDHEILRKSIPVGLRSIVPSPKISNRGCIHIIKNITLKNE